MDFPQKATIVEVMPRDGLQSWHTHIPTKNKSSIIDKLSKTGIRQLEVTSFVPPNLIPQFQDARDIIEHLPKNNEIDYRALVPNSKGAELAIEAGCNHLLGFVSCSETYSMKNQNKTIRENLDEINKIINLTQKEGIKLTIGLTNAFHCNFEGTIASDVVYKVFSELYKNGVRSFYLGATTGVANPRQVYERLRHLKSNYLDAEIGLHLHDLNGFAYANILAALQAGVTLFESSLLGIGGGIVKSSQPTPGNISTSTLVHFLHSMNIDTGIDEDKLKFYEDEIKELIYY